MLMPKSRKGKHYMLMPKSRKGSAHDLHVTPTMNFFERKRMWHAKEKT